MLNAGGSITVQANIATDGGNLDLYAGTIAVNTQSGPVTLSTRHLAAVPGDPANDASVDNSGKISFTGVNITLGSDTGSQGNANLYAQVEKGSTYTPGKIDLTASQLAGGGSGSGYNPPSFPSSWTAPTPVSPSTRPR